LNTPFQGRGRAKKARPCWPNYNSAVSSGKSSASTKSTFRRPSLPTHHCHSLHLNKGLTYTHRGPVPRRERPRTPSVSRDQDQKSYSGLHQHQTQDQGLPAQLDDAPSQRVISSVAVLFLSPTAAAAAAAAPTAATGSTSALRGCI
jgi:hypothetical protein